MAAEPRRLMVFLLLTAVAAMVNGCRGTVGTADQVLMVVLGGMQSRDVLRTDLLLLLLNDGDVRAGGAVRKRVID